MTSACRDRHLVYSHIYLGRKSTLFLFLVSPRAQPQTSPRCSPPPKQNPARASLVLVQGAGGEDAFPRVGETQKGTSRGSRGCSGARRPAGLTCVDAALALRGWHDFNSSQPLGFVLFFLYKFFCLAREAAGRGGAECGRGGAGRAGLPDPRCPASPSCPTPIASMTFIWKLPGATAEQERWRRCLCLCSSSRLFPNTRHVPGETRPSLPCAVPAVPTRCPRCVCSSTPRALSSAG